MYSIDDKMLSSELRRLREASAASDSVEPPGMVLLKDMLSRSTNEEDKYSIYRHLVSELTLIGDFAGALEWARRRFLEFGDIVSQCVVGSALLELGRSSEALNEFEQAFRAAVKSNELINYTFGEFMRAAVKMRELAKVESIAQEFLALKRPKAKADCALEDDWLDAAEALGARRHLIGKLRRRASRG